MLNGGAIYVADDPFEFCTSLDSVTLWGQCFFQIHELSGDNYTSIICIIANNTAGKAGSAVYGGMVDRCMLASHSTEPWEVFNEIYHITEGNLATSVIYNLIPIGSAPVLIINQIAPFTASVSQFIQVEHFQSQWLQLDREMEQYLQLSQADLTMNHAG